MIQKDFLHTIIVTLLIIPAFIVLLGSIIIYLATWAGVLLANPKFLFHIIKPFEYVPKANKANPVNNYRVVADTKHA